MEKAIQIVQHEKGTHKKKLIKHSTWNQKEINFYLDFVNEINRKEPNYLK